MMMCCGVRYEFSLVTAPKNPRVIAGDAQVVGTVRDAEETGPADPRRSDPVFPDADVPLGRQRKRAE